MVANTILMTYHNTTALDIEVHETCHLGCHDKNTIDAMLALLMGISNMACVS